MGFRSSVPSDPPSEPASSRRRSALGRLGALIFLAACGRRPAPPVLVAGAPWPAFELPGLDGRPRRLGEGGQACLVNFWATWCQPCRAEMAGLDRLQDTLGPAGLAVFGVAVDDDVNLVREFVREKRLRFPILVDRRGEVAQERLGIQAFPSTVLVGRDGRIAEVAVGARDWDVGPALAAARALL